MNLDDARKEINLIDKEMAVLFEKRMKTVNKIAQFKIENNLPVKNARREQAVIELNSEHISLQPIKPYYKKFIKNVIELSCDYQQELMNEKEKSK